MARRRRARERGQIVPLFALLMIVLTGFVALDLDSGVAFDQSRTDQDASDAASLAASYWIYSNLNDQPAPTNLKGAVGAAAHVANLDCIGPSAPCSLTLNFYPGTWTSSNPGSTLCSTPVTIQNVAVPSQVTAAENLFTCTATLASVYYVGVTVASTAYTYIGAPATGSRTFSVSNQAVAQVVGGTGGTGNGDLTIPCVLCILGGQNAYYVNSAMTEGFTIEPHSNGLDFTSDGGNMDINLGFECEATSAQAEIDTTGTSNGVVNIAGAYTNNCGTGYNGLTWNPNSNPKANTTAIKDPLANMPMPLMNCPNNENYGNTYSTTPITQNTELQPGCYENITIDPTTSNGGTLPFTRQNCVPDGSGIDVGLAAGTYIIYGNPPGSPTAGGLTVEGVNPTLESVNTGGGNNRTNPKNGQTCNAAGVTLFFVCSTGGSNPGPTACENNVTGDATPGAGLTLDTNDATGYGNGDYQWNLFPPTGGQQQNLVIIFDRYNSGTITTATVTSDPDSDHNGAIYAPSATYSLENYSSSGPVTNSGNSCTTPLGSPMIVDYMQIYANYSGCGNIDFDLDNDVQLNGGGPGGLTG